MNLIRAVRRRIFDWDDEYARILYLGVIMVCLVLGVLGITLYSMYTTAKSQYEKRLIEIVRNQARMFEAVQAYDEKLLTAQGYSEDEAFEASLGQLRSAHPTFEELGESGEFTVAKREEDLIVWLLRHRHSKDDIPLPTPWESLAAEPMRLALSGQSGIVTALDYRGKEVLAAYEPVDVGFSMGIVAKFDVSEVRAPFIRTGRTMLFVSMGLIAFGLYLFHRISHPLIHSLRQSEARFKNITEMSSVAIYMADAHGDCVYVNPLWKAHSGMTFSEALGDGWVKAIHPEDREHIVKSWKEMIASGSLWECEYRFIDKETGNVTWLSGLAKEMRDSNGTLHGYVGANIDITERKLAEAQVQKEMDTRLHQERLLIEQSRLAELGNMIRVVSHQWKQPLNVISMVDSLLLDLFKEDNPDKSEILENLKLIDEQVLLMSKTIDDFSNYNRPRSERMEFCAHQAVQEVYELFHELFLKGNCSVIIEECAECIVLGYKSEFMQVILNLFNNAVDAIHENGQQPGEISCKFECVDGVWIIRVRDNGGGIPDGLLPDRIFELNLTTKGDKGSGIGLYINRSIVEDHMDGRIWVHNVGDGAEFVIELPATKI